MEKEINYWKENNKIKANSKLPSCSANDYYNPNLNKVSTKIEFDEDFFIPKYAEKGSTCADIFINCKDKCISINCLGLKSIDCGFSIQINNGYRARIELDKIWSSRGMLLVGNPRIDSGKLERVSLEVLNIGDKQLLLDHKEKIGIIWIEPVYFFEWI